MYDRAVVLDCIGLNKIEQGVLNIEASECTYTVYLIMRQ